VFYTTPFIVSDGESWSMKLLNNHILSIFSNIGNKLVLPFDKVDNRLLFDLRILRFDRHEPCVSSLGAKGIRANPIFRLIDYILFIPRRNQRLFGRER